MDYDRAKMLRRRIYHSQQHIQFLEHLATDPTTIDAELYRRYELISELKEQISQHMKRITSMMEMANNVQDHLAQAEAKLRSLKKSQDKLLLDKYIEEYLALNKRIEKEQ